MPGAIIGLPRWGVVTHGRTGLKILFLQKRPLFPANTGGKIRTLNVVQHLAQWHQLTYLCNVLSEEEPYLDQMRELGLDVIAIPWQEAARDSWRFYAGLAGNVFSRYPYSVNKDYDQRIRQRVQKLLAEQNYDLIICDFVQMARNVEGFHSIPRLLFQHNVEAMIYRRLADNESNTAKRWFIRGQQRKMEAFEARAGRSFDRVVAVSHQDKRAFAEEYGWQHVDVIDTAVDTNYFHPLGQPKIDGRLVFVGSMDWLPNQEGVLRFVKEILPRIREFQPGVTLDIVGRNPPPSITRLAKQSGVRVTGTVEDVRPYLSRATVCIVPLYSGGGTRLKIFEAMASGTPVVSTTLGADGLNITDGEHWLRADSDAEFADAVCRLVEHPDDCVKISQSALQHVREHYTSEAIARQFETICHTLIEQH